MAFACSMKNVGNDSKNCLESFSGLSTDVYVFTEEQLVAADANVTYADDKAEFDKASFSGVEVTRIKLKVDTGKVDHSNNPNGGGFNNVFTGLVADDMETMSFISRVMNNRNDWGMLVPDGNGKMYVIYAPGRALKFEETGTTGDTADSDHGHTITVTAGPCLYPLVKWDGSIKKTGADGTIKFECEANA